MDERAPLRVGAALPDPPFELDGADGPRTWRAGRSGCNGATPPSRWPTSSRAGRIAAVRRYAYRDILTALDDLQAGRVDGFMKLEPVMRWLTRDRPTLDVVQTGITQEDIGVAVRHDDTDLAGRIDGVLDELRGDGTLAGLGRRWLGTDAPGTATSVLA